jgi:hypothetical protein
MAYVVGSQSTTLPKIKDSIEELRKTQTLNNC